jgi:FO synthase subunit 1
MGTKGKKKKNQKVITYSSGVVLIVSCACRNRCGYCSFWRHDYTLFVPYNTIRLAKNAVKKGGKEILIFSGERPDRFHPVKNTLDLWGFPSFARYLYTICELAFLEGLLPRLNVGYLSFQEMALLREVSVALEVSLGATDSRFFKPGAVHQFSPGKSLDVVTETLENAGRLKIPVSINFLVGVGEKVGERKAEINLLCSLHEKFGHIQEVAINNYVPMPGAKFSKARPPKNAEILGVVKLLRRLLPPEVAISFKPWRNLAYLQLLRARANDLGLIPLNLSDFLTGRKIEGYEQMRKKIIKNNFTLVKRLPIYPKYIQMGWYSGKMGQILDKYREEIKEVNY